MKKFASGLLIFSGLVLSGSALAATSSTPVSSTPSTTAPAQPGSSSAMPTPGLMRGGFGYSSRGMVMRGGAYAPRINQAGGIFRALAAGITLLLIWAIMILGIIWLVKMIRHQDRLARNNNDNNSTNPNNK